MGEVFPYQKWSKILKTSWKRYTDVKIKIIYVKENFQLDLLICNLIALLQSNYFILIKFNQI